jgi:hypothetical protein
MVIRRDIMVMRLTMAWALVIGRTATTATGLITIIITGSGLDTEVGGEADITGAEGVMVAVDTGVAVTVAGVAGKPDFVG